MYYQPRFAVLAYGDPKAVVRGLNEVPRADWPPVPAVHAALQVVGYRVTANDGSLGDVEDLLVDDREFRVCSLVVDARKWWPSKSVPVPVDEVDRIDSIGRAVYVNVDRDELRLRAGIH